MGNMIKWIAVAALSFSSLAGTAFAEEDPACPQLVAAYQAAVGAHKAALLTITQVGGAQRSSNLAELITKATRQKAEAEARLKIKVDRDGENLSDAGQNRDRAKIKENEDVITASTAKKKQIDDALKVEGDAREAKNNAYDAAKAKNCKGLSTKPQ